MPSPARRWGCTRQQSLPLPHRPRPKPRGHFPCQGKEESGVVLVFASPWRGKCRVFEAMGVYAPDASSLPHRPRPKPRGHFPCKGKEESGVVLVFASPWRGKCRAPRGDGGVRARRLFSTPSTSAKAPRPLPLQGEGKNPARRLSAGTPPSGSSPALGGSRRLGKTSTPSPSLRSGTSPARGRKKWGRHLRAGTPRGSRSAASGTPPSGSSPALLGRFRLRGKGRRAAQRYVDGRQNATLTGGRMLR